MAQFILELVLFTSVCLFSLILILLLYREKFFHAHVHLSCLAIWFLLSLFAIIPIIFREYTSVIRLIGIVTFSITAIHTTLPVPRSWTLLMALTTSIIHLILVMRTHDLRDSNNKSHRMEFKLEVDTSAF